MTEASVTEAIWLDPEPVSEAQVAPYRARGHSRVLSEILVRRGLGVADLDTFLDPELHPLPDPSSMRGLDRAAERIVQGIKEQQTILIHGDYDVDGLTSTTLLTRALRSFGAGTIHPFVPHRFTDGYGVAERIVARLEENPLPLMITCDVGVAEAEKVARATRAGTDVVVTDHHQAPSSGVPESALAVVNPNQPGCAYPDKTLAGVGVAYMVLRRVAELLGRNPDEALAPWMDLVACGTVADVVPLRRTNRLLVVRGLRKLRDDPLPPLLALLNAAGVARNKVRASTIGYQIGPRLNAVGRLDAADHGLRLLLEDDLRVAIPKARDLGRVNDARKAVQAVIQRAIQVRLDEGSLEEQWAIVEGDPGWHVGVVGIAASKVTETTGRASFIFGRSPTGGPWRGSGRAPEREGLSLLHLLHEIKSVLPEGSAYGGHARAAGMTLGSTDPRALDAVREALSEAASRILTREDIRPRHQVDAWMELKELDGPLIHELEAIEPTGEGNRPPKLGVRGVQVRGVHVMGSESQHMKFSVASDDGTVLGEVLAWGWAQNRKEALDWVAGTRLDLLGTPELNVFRGQERIQMILEDARVAQ